MPTNTTFSFLLCCNTFKFAHRKRHCEDQGSGNLINSSSYQKIGTADKKISAP